MSYAMLMHYNYKLTVKHLSIMKHSKVCRETNNAKALMVVKLVFVRTFDKWLSIGFQESDSHMWKFSNFQIGIIMTRCN